MHARILLVAVLIAGFGVAEAQRACDRKTDKDCVKERAVKVTKVKPPKSPPVINIGPMDLVGKVRGAMMLQFLERADEELQRASLEQRSFVPELVRTLDSEAL
jgi:hypothetical protein